MSGPEAVHHEPLLTDIAELLPPPVDAHPLPHRGARRVQLLRQFDQPAPRPRWGLPAPVLAAGALAATVAIAALGVTVLDRDTGPTPPARESYVWTNATAMGPAFRIPKPALTSMPELLRRIDRATASQPRVDLAGNEVVFRQRLPVDAGASPTDTWTTVDGRRVLTRRGSVTKPMDIYVSAEGTALEQATWYPSYRTLRAIEHVTPQAVLDQLTRNQMGTTGDPAVYRFTTIQRMLAVGVAPPKLRATLFRAMASIRGVKFDRAGPAPYQGLPRMVLSQRWTTVDVFTGDMFADQDFRYVPAAVAAGLGDDAVGEWMRQPGFGALRPVGHAPFDQVSLAVPDPYEPLAPATSVAFRQRVGEARGPRWPLHYEVLDGSVTADVNADGRSDLVTVIDVHGAGGEGPPESSFVVAVYVRDPSGLVPFGVVQLVAPLSTGPSVSVTNGVITVRPNSAGNSPDADDPVSYRWNGVWFAPTS